MTAITTVTQAREAGMAQLASSDWMTAVYYDLPFGQVAVVRSGQVFLADEYDAGTVGAWA
jgi:hypothetical protein